MNDTETKDTLQRLARTVVANEVVTEHFLRQGRPATLEEIFVKFEEVTIHLDENLAQRFPGLFP